MTSARTHRLSITTSAEGDAAHTSILVDGIDLLPPRDPAAGSFLIPADPTGLLPPDSRVLLPSEVHSHAMVGICNCGVSGDNSLWITVRRAGDTVLWEPWPGTPHQTIDRTLAFDLVDYLDAVDEGARSVAEWEERPRILARELRRRRDRLHGPSLGPRVDLIGARAWPGVNQIQVVIAGPHGTDFFDHPVAAELSDDEVLAGVGAASQGRPNRNPPSPAELLALVLSGPDLPVRGTISTHVEVEDRPRNSGGPVPTALDQSRLDVWRDGARLRVQLPDGSPVLVVGDDKAWRFAAAQDAPVEIDPGDGAASLVAVDLLTRGTLSGATDPATGVRFESWIGRSTFQDRPTWGATLRRPDGQEPIYLEVDLETGLVLSERTGSGTVVEWTELVVGEAPDPALFTWDGSARSAGPGRAARHAAQVALEQHRKAWFTEHVLSEPLRIGAHLNLDSVPLLDEDTGVLDARFGRSAVRLRRRPRSERPWPVQGQRWSTSRWDWAVHFRGGRLLQPEVVADIQDQLADR